MGARHAEGSRVITATPGSAGRVIDAVCPSLLGSNEVILVVRVESPYVPDTVPSREVVSGLVDLLMRSGVEVSLLITARYGRRSELERLYGFRTVDTSTLTRTSVKVVDREGSVANAYLYREVYTKGLLIARPRTDDVFSLAGAAPQLMLSALTREALSIAMGSLASANVNTVIVNLCRNPLCSLLEGTYVIEGDAPFLGRARRWGYVVLSKDPLLLDMAVSRLLLLPQEPPYLEFLRRVAKSIHLPEPLLLGDAPAPIRLTPHRFSAVARRYGGLEFLMRRAEELISKGSLCGDKPLITAPEASSSCG